MPIQRLLDWSIWLYNSKLPFLPNSDRVQHCQRYLDLRLVPHGYLRDWLHGHCLFYLLPVLSFLDNLDWLYHSQLRHPRCKHRLCSWQWINHVWLDLLDELRHRQPLVSVLELKNFIRPRLRNNRDRLYF
jgi:hypothetical protein